MDKEIIPKLGIYKPELYDYIKKYPNFFNALKIGEGIVDIEVESYMYQNKKSTLNAINGNKAVFKGGSFRYGTGKTTTEAD